MEHYSKMRDTQQYQRAYNCQESEMVDAIVRGECIATARWQDKLKLVIFLTVCIMAFLAGTALGSWWLMYGIYHHG